MKGCHIMDSYERDLETIVGLSRDLAALAEEMLRRHTEKGLSHVHPFKDLTADLVTANFVGATARHLETSAVTLRHIISRHDMSKAG